MLNLQLCDEFSQYLIVPFELRCCLTTVFEKELRNCDFGLDIGMMSHVIFPTFLPKRINLSHLIIGINVSQLIIGIHFSNFLLKTVRLNKTLALFQSLAVP